MDNYSGVHGGCINEAQQNVANLDPDQIRRQGEVEATDAARREARERGVDLTKVEGTGSRRTYHRQRRGRGGRGDGSRRGRAASEAAQGGAQQVAGAQAPDQAGQVAGQAQEAAGQATQQVQDTAGGPGCGSRGAGHRGWPHRWPAAGRRPSRRGSPIR